MSKRLWASKQKVAPLDADARRQLRDNHLSRAAAKLVRVEDRSDYVWRKYDPYGVEQPRREIFLRRALLIWPWGAANLLLAGLRVRRYRPDWRPCWSWPGRRRNPALWLYLVVTHFIDMRGTIPAAQLPGPPAKRTRGRRRV